jgi:hypothetical protein
VKRLIALLLGVALSWSCALPSYAKARKVKLNPEARAAMKRNKAQQKRMKKLAKARNRQYLKAIR